MNTSHGTRRLSKAALAGLAVGGFTFGVVSFLAASAWDTPVGSAAKAPAGSVNPTAGPSSMGVATATSAVNARHHAKPAPNPTEPVVLSTNWAGPVITGGTYSQVTTTFVVPTAKCSSQNTDSSFWAGIDGSGTSQTVEQAGVRVSCVHRHAQYVPWVEEFPAPESDIDPSVFTVAPGDTLHVTVVANPSTDTYTLDDVTSGAKFTTRANAPQGATDSSAECIAEAPTGSHGIEKLTDFGTVDFSQCQVRVAVPAAAHCQIVNGHGCPGDSQITYTNIASRHHHKNRLQAETMSTNGGGFTVTWHHS